MPLAEHGEPCPHCLGKGLFPFGRVLRLCNFDEPVRHLIHRLKFHHGWSLGEFLADRLCAQDEVRALLQECDVVVPVPLHPLRQIARGYNQAKVIARRLARLSRRRMVQPAIRLVHTSAQTEVHSKTQRLENLHHAFGLLYPRRIDGKRIVVIDDVRTTAATLQSFGRCLKQGKPESIDAVVVAVADWHNSGFEKI
jgi:ComF family protein